MIESLLQEVLGEGDGDCQLGQSGWVGALVTLQEVV